MNQRIAIAASLLAVFGTAHSADVYRSTAPDGTVTYSDRPQGSDAQFVFAAATRSSQSRPSDAPASATAATDESAPQAPANPTLPEGPSAAELRAQRQKNCEVARETMDRYALTNRLFRTNAAGEREYLDEAAVAEARAKAAADVEDWCS
jgi:hypothetical protein